MNLTTTQIIIIGAAIVFGTPITVGLVVGHFFGVWLGVLAGGLLCLLVVYIGHRYMVKMVRDKEKEKENNNIDCP